MEEPQVPLGHEPQGQPGHGLLGPPAGVGHGNGSPGWWKPGQPGPGGAGAARRDQVVDHLLDGRLD
ncbi:MAG: hypothetical protein ACLGIO_05535, partial [Acidimicrobiia bacterium]